MSRKRKQSYNGCSVESHRGRLHLRFRVVLPHGNQRHVSRATGLADTPENRRACAAVAKLVGAAIRAGHSLSGIDQILVRSYAKAPSSASPAAPSATDGETLEQFYERWIPQQELLVRKGQRLDYHRHLERYVLPILGPKQLADLRTSDTRGLQAELLARKSKRSAEGKRLSVKFVKNIILGSYRALIRDAEDEGLIQHPVFPRKMKWPRWEPPSADPFTPEERDRIIEWFRIHQFRVPEGCGRYVLRPHAPFYVFVHLSFWTGLRPSEALGLQDGDVDYPGGRVQVQRSHYLYELGDTKTRAARRTVELFPGTVDLLRSIRLPDAKPEMPIFTNTLGHGLDQQAFKEHWYNCLRELNIRKRGIYCMKDTFVSTSLAVGVKIRWLEQQTGEDYATLKKHYSRWMPLDVDSELRRFQQIGPSLFGAKETKLSARKRQRGGQFPVSGRKNSGFKVVPRGFEPLLPT